MSQATQTQPPATPAAGRASGPDLLYSEDETALRGAVRSLLEDPARAERMGLQAKERVRSGFLGTRTLIQAIELYERYLQLTRASGPGS